MLPDVDSMLMPVPPVSPSVALEESSRPVLAEMRMSMSDTTDVFSALRKTSAAGLDTEMLPDPDSMATPAALFIARAPPV